MQNRRFIHTVKVWKERIWRDHQRASRVVARCSTRKGGAPWIGSVSLYLACDCQIALGPPLQSLDCVLHEGI